MLVKTPLMHLSCRRKMSTVSTISSYVEDMNGGAVLVSLEEPTQDASFRSMTEKWTELGWPIASVTFVHLIVCGIKVRSSVDAGAPMSALCSAT